MNKGWASPDSITAGSVAYSTNLACPVFVIEVYSSTAVFLRLQEKATTGSFELPEPVEGMGFLSLQPRSGHVSSLEHLKFFKREALEQLLSLMPAAPFPGSIFLESGSSRKAVASNVSVLLSDLWQITHERPCPYALSLEDSNGDVWYVKPGNENISLVSKSSVHQSRFTPESLDAWSKAIQRARSVTVGDIVGLADGRAAVVVKKQDSMLETALIQRRGQFPQVDAGLDEDGLVLSLDMFSCPPSSARLFLGSVPMETITDFKFWAAKGNSGAPGQVYPTRGSLVQGVDGDVLVLDFPPIDVSPKGLEIIGLKRVQNLKGSLKIHIPGLGECFFERKMGLYQMASPKGPFHHISYEVMRATLKQVSQCDTPGADVISFWTSQGGKPQLVKGLPVRRSRMGKIQCLKVGGDHRFGVPLRVIGPSANLNAHTSILSFSPEKDSFFYTGEKIHESSLASVLDRFNLLQGPSRGYAPLEEASSRFYRPESSNLPMVGHIYQSAGERIFVTSRTSEVTSGFLVTPRSSLLSPSRSLLLPAPRDVFPEQFVVTELPVEIPTSKVPKNAFPAIGILPEISLRSSLPLLEGGFEPYGTFGRTGNHLLMSWDVALEERSGETQARRLCLDLSTRPREGFVPFPGWTGRDPLFYRPMPRSQPGPIDDLWGFFGLSTLEGLSKDMIKRMASELRSSPRLVWAPVKFANGGDVKVRPIVTFEVRSGVAKALVLSSSKSKNHAWVREFPFASRREDPTRYIHPVVVSLDLSSSGFKIDSELNPEQLKVLRKALRALPESPQTATTLPSWRYRCEHFYDPPAPAIPGTPKPSPPRSV